MVESVELLLEGAFDLERTWDVARLAQGSERVLWLLVLFLFFFVQQENEFKKRQRDMKKKES